MDKVELATTCYSLIKHRIHHGMVFIKHRDNFILPHHTTH